MERREMERQILRCFVTDALAAGFRLAVSLDRGYDTEDMLLGSRDMNKILEEAMAGDDAHVFVQPPSGPLLDAQNHVVSLGWIFLVFGNDGWDVVSDYAANDVMENLLARATALSDTFSEAVT